MPRMKKNEFYDVRTRKHVTVDEKNITVKVIPGSKYRDGKPRYQLVGKSGRGKLVYKFASAEDGKKYLAKGMKRFRKSNK